MCSKKNKCYCSSITSNSVNTLISDRSIYETMITNILIKKRHDEITTKGITSNDKDSIYSLVDKPYYVDGLLYKVDN